MTTLEILLGDASVTVRDGPVRPGRGSVDAWDLADRPRSSTSR